MTVSQDLIVSLPQLRLVLDRLRSLGVRHADPTTSAPLGLARVPLPEVTVDGPAARRTVRAQLRGKGGRREPLPGYTVAADADPMDQLLWALRNSFADQWPGWTPLLGKNRVLGSVHGAQGSIIHQGVGDPKARRAPQVMRAPRAAGPGGGVRVGVLDTKISPHPWLARGWSAGADAVLTRRRPPVAAGHATFVTGLVLNQAPGALVEEHAVLDAKGRATSWDVAECMVRVGNSGIDVLNLSLVCVTEDNQPPLVLATAVDRLPPDVVVVAAAGNYVTPAKATPPGGHRPAWPAALDDVVAVGATKRNGKRAAWSPLAPWIDVETVGVNVRSTYLRKAVDGNGYLIDFPDRFAEWSGTSFAAALLSGAVAAGTVPGRVTSRQSLERLLAAGRNRSPARIPYVDLTAP